MKDDEKVRSQVRLVPFGLKSLLMGCNQSVMWHGMLMPLIVAAKSPNALADLTVLAPSREYGIHLSDGHLRSLTDPGGGLFFSDYIQSEQWGIAEFDLSGITAPIESATLSFEAFNGFYDLDPTLEPRVSVHELGQVGAALDDYENGIVSPYTNRFSESTWFGYASAEGPSILNEIDVTDHLPEAESIAFVFDHDVMAQFYPPEFFGYIGYEYGNPTLSVQVVPVPGSAVLGIAGLVVVVPLKRRILGFTLHADRLSSDN